MSPGIQLKRDLPIAGRPPAERPEPKAWSEVGAPIALTLTANAGTLIEYRGEKLLVDGIHDSTAHAFSRVPEAMLEDLTAGRGGFAGIRFLLFTHLHADHFSGLAVRRFLERNPVERLFLPPGNGGPGVDDGINPLREFLMREGTPVQELDIPLGRTVCFPLSEGMRLTAFCSQHAGAEYEATPHYCFLLSAGGKNLLFLGDSDYDEPFFASMLAGVKIDTAVVNPLFINKSAGRKTLLEGVRPARIVVNHLPFHGEDTLLFRDMLARDLARHRDALPPTAVLWDPMDSMTL